MVLPPQTVEFLRRVKDGKVRANDGRDIWRAMRVPGLVTLVGRDGGPLNKPIKHQDVVGFKLTRRGEETLEAPPQTQQRAFQALPRETQHWLSALKRCFRNKPRGILVVHDDHNLVIRDEGGVIDTLKNACS